MLERLLNKQQRYDLPLHQDEGTGFVLVLIALMAFLSTLVLGFSIGLNQVMAGWSNPLENKITIEIPVQAQGSVLRSPDDIMALQQDIIRALAQDDNIRSAEAVSRDSLLKMVHGWLGESSFLDDIPLPALVSVELIKNSAAITQALQDRVQAIDQYSYIDTHASWLADLFKLTRTLQAGLLVIVSIIALTTVAAVVGAMKAQIEIHRSDVELLHLIGAQDSYISGQFVRHAGALSSIGSIAGMIAGIVILSVLMLFIGAQDYQIFPSAAFSFWLPLSFLAVPLIISIISALSARHTILTVLRDMP